MSARYTLVLLLVLLGLGAYVYFVEMPREEREELAKQLFDIEASQVDRIEIQRGDETIQLARRDDSWRLVEPVDAAADDTAVESLVNAVADCSIDKDLGSIGDDLARFGLAEPQIRITLAGDADASFTVAVGKTAPVGNVVYLQRESDGHVLLTQAGFRSTVDKQADDLRDRRLFDVDNDDVRWFEIHRGHASVRLERGDDDAWTLTLPDAYDADATAVRTYLSSLSALRVASFVADDVDSFAEYGLEEPALRIAFGTADETTREVRFGGEQTETEIYASLGEAGSVYTVNDWAFRNLNKSARDLRDKSLFSFAAEDVRAVNVVRQDGNDFRLVRDGDGWNVEGAEGTAKQDEIEAYIDDLAGLAGYEIVSDAPDDLAAFALDEPVLQVSTFGADDAPLGSVIIGRTEGADGLKNFNAKNAEQPTVVLLRAYVFNRLNKAPVDLVDAPAPAAEPTVAEDATPNG